MPGNISNTSCPQKLLLVDAIRATIDEITMMHREELAAVIRGDFSASGQMRALLRQARENQRMLIARYREYRDHVADHGCATRTAPPRAIAG